MHQQPSSFRVPQVSVGFLTLLFPSSSCCPRTVQPALLPSTAQFSLFPAYYLIYPYRHAILSRVSRIRPSPKRRLCIPNEPSARRLCGSFTSSNSLLPIACAFFLRSFHSFTKDYLATLLPLIGSALFSKTTRCMGFFPFWNGATETRGSPRICATVAACGLPAFSQKDRARRQPNLKFEGRAERRLRGGQRGRPASNSRREAAPPGNRERREDGR